MKNKLITSLLLTTLSGCGPSQSDYEAATKKSQDLSEQVASLSKELDELKFGASRLLAQGKNSLDKNDPAGAKRILTELLERHSTSAESVEAKNLLAQSEKLIAEIAAKDEAEEIQRQKTRKAEQERVLRNLTKKTDQITGITWVSHKDAPKSGTYSSIYFGTKDGQLNNYPLRINIQYYGDDWLFIQSMTIKADEKIYEISGQKFERDNAGGSVWEWVDVPIKDGALLEKMITAKNVTIRFNGQQYHHDFKLPQRQKDQMKDVFNAWKNMGGSL